MTRIEKLIGSQTYAIGLVDEKIKKTKSEKELEIIQAHYDRLTYIRLCLVNFNTSKGTKS